MLDAPGTVTWDERDQGPAPSDWTGRVNTYGPRGGQYHHYAFDGEPVVGVTTVISKGVSKGDALNRWAAKMVAEAAVDTRPYWSRLDRDAAVSYLKQAPYRHKTEAGARGTEVHSWAEHYGETGSVPKLGGVDPIIRGQVEAMSNFLVDFDVEVLLSEVVVFNRAEMYAGTTDLFAVLHALPGEPTALLDWKTNKGGIYPETALQLAAYRYADCYLDPTTGTRVGVPGVTFTGAVHLPAEPGAKYERGYALVELQADRPVYRTFLEAKKLAAWADNNKKVIRSSLFAPPVVELEAVAS